MFFLQLFNRNQQIPTNQNPVFNPGTFIQLLGKWSHTTINFMENVTFLQQILSKTAKNIHKQVLNELNYLVIRVVEAFGLYCVDNYLLLRWLWILFFFFDEKMMWNLKELKRVGLIILTFWGRKVLSGVRWESMGTGLSCGFCSFGPTSLGRQ